MNSWVYFIACLGPGGPIKIGYSEDVKTRMSDLQGANPYELVLIHKLHGDRTDEGRMHKRFFDFRIYGTRSEWFFPSPELTTYIERLRTGRSTPCPSCSAGVPLGFRARCWACGCGLVADIHDRWLATGRSTGGRKRPAKVEFGDGIVVERDQFEHARPRDAREMVAGYGPPMDPLQSDKSTFGVFWNVCVAMGFSMQFIYGRAQSGSVRGEGTRVTPSGGRPVPWTVRGGPS